MAFIIFIFLIFSIPHCTTHYSVCIISLNCGFFHVEQVNGFSSVWILSCFLRLLDCLNDLSHFEQLNGFSPVWILSWVFKWLDTPNFLSHFEQLNGLSPVWILSWLFKRTAWLNDLSRFLISVDSFMCLQMNSLIECLVTLWAAKWFLISVYSFMSL